MVAFTEKGVAKSPDIRNPFMNRVGLGIAFSELPLDVT